MINIIKAINIFGFADHTVVCGDFSTLPLHVKAIIDNM